MNAGCCLELPTQAAPLKPQRRHQEYSVFLMVIRHLFVFICDEIEPVRLVARRSDQGDQTLRSWPFAWVRKGGHSKTRRIVHRSTASARTGKVHRRFCQLMLTSARPPTTAGQLRKSIVTPRKSCVTARLWQPSTEFCRKATSEESLQPIHCFA